MKRPVAIHFMGIGGSGMSAVAQIAHNQGYRVSGCDINLETPYIDKIKKLNIPVSPDHSANHLQNIDILAVTPAIFYQNDAHPETKLARKRHILTTWQEFMGKYLHKGKFLICIAGTHGKSTTTTMVGLLLETAGLDPTVEIGATVPIWHSNMRVGKSKYFISEADEYYHNFLHYHPDIIILNNIEMDHPEYFHSFDKLLETYLDFIKNLKPDGVLIYNADNPGNRQLITKIPDLKLKTKLVPYSISEFPQDLKLGVPGNHNKSNALGIIQLAKVLSIDPKIVYKTLSSFIGISRRIELLGEKNSIKVYDDYANHPTAFAATLQAVKEVNPNSKIWAVIEPHTFSRLRAVLDNLPSSLKSADQVIISKIFASREADPGDFTGADIAKASRHPHVRYIPEFSDIISTLKSEIKPTHVILVMGSGDSYKLSRSILESL